MGTVSALKCHILVTRRDKVRFKQLVAAGKLALPRKRINRAVNTMPGKVPIPAYLNCRTAQQMYSSRVYLKVAETAHRLFRQLAPLKLLAAGYWVYGDDRYLKAACAQMEFLLRHFPHHRINHWDTGLIYSQIVTDLLYIFELVSDGIPEGLRKDFIVFLKKVRREIYKNHFLWFKYQSHQKHNNHMFWRSAALGLIGLYLDHAPDVGFALNNREGFKKAVAGGILDRSVWIESSFTYHQFAATPQFIFALALKNAGHRFSLASYRAPNGNRLDMLVDHYHLAFPDLSLPAFGDAYALVIHLNLSLYVMAYNLYRKPVYAWIIKQLEKKKTGNLRAASLFADFYRLPLTPVRRPATASRIMKKHGYFMIKEKTGAGYWYRPGWAVAGHYGYSGIHHHWDQLGIILFNRRLLACDYEGLSTYGFCSKIARELNRTAFVHNTITVDKKPHCSTLAGYRPLRLVKAGLQTQNQSIRINDQGRLWPGVKLERTLTVQRGRITDWFQASSRKIHTYDWVLHALDEQGCTRGPLKWHPVKNVYPARPPFNWIQDLEQGKIKGPETEVYWIKDKIRFTLCLETQPGDCVYRFTLPFSEDKTGIAVPGVILRRKCRSTVFKATYTVET